MKTIRPLKWTMIAAVILSSGVLPNVGLAATAEAVEEEFDIRAWVLLDYNMPYLREIIPVAAKEGINHIQLCHRIGMQLAEYEEPERNRDIRELIDLMHEHGIKAYVWTHELDDVPERFTEGGKVAAHGEEFWRWMGSRYEKLLELLPEVDGVVVTLTETRVPIDDDNLVISPLDPSERFVRMAKEIYNVMHPRGKDVILRTFTWIPEDYDWMLDAFREIPEEIIIMSKVNWGDWYQNFPSNPFIGKVAPHRQIVEYDLAGQYHGDLYVPWVCAEFLQQEIRYARSQNAAGIIGRVDWSGHAYGSANEFSAVAFAALAKNPEVDLDALWMQWATGKYGPDAAPHIVSALKRTNEIANRLFFTLDFKAFQYSCRLRSLSYMDGSRVMHARFCRDVQGRWKPELIPAAEEQINPTMKTLWKTVQEKKQAIRLIDASIRDIEKAEPHLTETDYGYFSAAFRNERIIAEAWRWIHEAYYRYLFQRQGDKNQREPLLRSLDEIDKIADEIDRFYDDSLVLLTPLTLHNFAADIRTTMDPVIEWFAVMDHESGRRPLLFDLHGDGTREVVVNGRDNRVHAFEQPGTEVWGHDTFGLRVRYPHVSDPVAADVDDDGKDDLLAGGADGVLYVFDRAGELKWQYKTGNGIVAAPTILKEKNGSPVTICASLDGFVYGLGPQGGLLWKQALDGVAEANPVTYGAGPSIVVFGTREGLVQAFDASSVPAWKQELPGPLTGGLSLHTLDGKLFIAAGCGRSLVLIDGAGEVVDTLALPAGGGEIAAETVVLVLDRQQVFLIGTNQGNLHAVERNGNVRFSTQLGAEIRTPVVPVTVDGEPLLLLGVDNSVVALELNGRERARFTATSDGLIGAGLVVEDGRVIFTAMDRKTYVVTLREILNGKGARTSMKNSVENKQTFTFKNADGCAIKADVYGADGTVRPVIVWYHGGALIVGGRESISRNKFNSYIEAGYVVVSIGYRLAPETKLAEIIQDIQDGYAWVHKTGPELFNIDPERMAVGGGSAGGYLSLMAGFCVEPRPKAIVSFFGYGDITEDWYTKPAYLVDGKPTVTEAEALAAVGDTAITAPPEGSQRHPFYMYCRQNGLWPKWVSGHDPATEPRWFDACCPIRNVTPAYPPTIFLHGDDDEDVPYEQSVSMAAKLKSVGVEHKLLTIHNGMHGFRNGDPDEIERALAEVVPFLDRYMKNAK